MKLALVFFSTMLRVFVPQKGICQSLSHYTSFMINDSSSMSCSFFTIVHASLLLYISMSCTAKIFLQTNYIENLSTDIMIHHPALRLKIRWFFACTNSFIKNRIILANSFMLKVLLCVFRVFHFPPFSVMCK